VKTVLIVDDDAAIREALQSLLEPAGMNVRLASDAYEAGHELAERNFDAVVTDLRMPGGGESVLAYAHEVQPETPVIVMSSSEGLLERVARRERAFAWLDKFCVAERLVGLLGKAFALSENRRPAAAN
jgi:DNA-binding NtrC family response regulator